MKLRRVMWPGAVLIVAVLVLLAGVLPTRAYLAQRRQIAREAARVEVLREQNRRLEARAAELRTDGAIERLAREQYNLVRPDEEAYAILPAPGQIGTEQAEPVGADEGSGSWWSKVWSSLRFWD